MDAAGICDLLISSIKASNLNFYLSESPFQVQVTIKKSFVKRYESESPSTTTMTPLSIFTSQLEGKHDTFNGKHDFLDGKSDPLFSSTYGHGTTIKLDPTTNPFNS